MTIKIN